MKVKALRGVCIGVDAHLKVGETAELPDAAMAAFLVSIGAVECVADAPAEKAAAKPATAPSAAAAPATTTPEPVERPVPPAAQAVIGGIEPQPVQEPAKRAGKKE